MLNKAILLNIQIGSKQMGTALGLAIIESFFLCFFSNTMMLTGSLYIFCYGVVILYSIKGINRVFYTSFFDDDGTLYMTLPVPAKDMILGKLFTVAGFLFIQGILFHLALMLPLTLGSPNAETALSNLSLFVEPSGYTTSEITLAFTMYPPIQFIEICFQCSILLTTFITLGARKKRLLLCWIAAVFLLLLFGAGDVLISKLFADATYGTVLAKILCSVVYIFISWICVKKSIRDLEEKLNI